MFYKRKKEGNKTTISKTRHGSKLETIGGEKPMMKMVEYYQFESNKIYATKASTFIKEFEDLNSEMYTKYTTLFLQNRLIYNKGEFNILRYTYLSEKEAIILKDFASRIKSIQLTLDKQNGTKGLTTFIKSCSNLFIIEVQEESNPNTKTDFFPILKSTCYKIQLIDLKYAKFSSVKAIPAVYRYQSLTQLNLSKVSFKTSHAKRVLLSKLVYLNLSQFSLNEVSKVNDKVVTIKGLTSSIEDYKESNFDILFYLYLSNRVNLEIKTKINTKEEAIFWLHEVKDSKAICFLDSIEFGFDLFKYKSFITLQDYSRLAPTPYYLDPEEWIGIE